MLQNEYVRPQMNDGSPKKWGRKVESLLVVRSLVTPGLASNNCVLSLVVVFSLVNSSSIANMAQAKRTQEQTDGFL